MSIEQYIKELDRQFRAGKATEHSHRPALQGLLKALAPDVLATNEPKQIECGAPDFVLTRNNIPLGYIEAKDIGKNLDDPAYKEQLRRYAESLDNLIFTNYTEFRLFREGRQVSAVSVANVIEGKVKASPGNFDAFKDLHRAFIGYEGRTITSADELAKRMAAKARLLARVIAAALVKDGDTNNGMQPANSDLQSQLEGLRKHLIHDIEVADFADIYAQTVAYGMFAARLHDPTPATFSRQEAAQLIPANNPFLRKFFQHIAGYDLDERIRWIVDDLADIFRAADVGELMKDYGKATRQNDPFIHFYETFLGEYNPKLRKSRGVYYTPEPVVDFIVRAADDILQSELGLPQGLADIGKTVIDIEPLPSGDRQDTGKTEKHEKEVHKVQILDPAAGTGTFLAAIVRHIYHKRFASQKGLWPDYVREHLIPRLNGFEVLMAPYAMAHTKLEMTLRETGCEPKERLRIFLTNSLEEHYIDIASLQFAEWLSTEANEANAIKRETPVMVVIGNPPYKGESANKGKWIGNLLRDYKQEPGGGKLREKNIKWLNDDYVKFLCYGQRYIDRTDKGVLAYINNHSFLDNPSFRGMRWSLLQSFDKMYIIDLHGNARKKETAPDGSADRNVFDIQQGVSINLFVKTGKKEKDAPARVFHYDLYGTREGKYQFLQDNDLERIGFTELKPQAPQYDFVPRDYGLQTGYDKGFSVSDLLPVHSVGIVTARDGFAIHHTPQELRRSIARFRTLDDETARARFSLGPDVRDWKVNLARQDLENNVFGNRNDKPAPVCYRPFDIRYTYYTGNSKGFHCMPRGEVMRHFIKGENAGLIFPRRSMEKGTPVFLSKSVVDKRGAHAWAETVSYLAPLYLYPDTDRQILDGEQERQPNLNPDIVQAIAAKLELRFTDEKEDGNNTFAPIDLLDYIYAVLHSPAYRERYKESLKTDFPRVPYPTDKKRFRQLISLGGELRALHLLESPTLDTLITGYPEPGDNAVAKPEYQLTDFKSRLGKVHINQTQRFTEVPEAAWNFCIGGYQPAQKWLKDRKGRMLGHDDIIHYQKIIAALTETARLMEKIDTLPVL